MKIKKFDQLSLEIEMTDFFIENLRGSISENVKEISKHFIEDLIGKIKKDLKLHFYVISHGAVVPVFYPLVTALMTNSSLSVQLDSEKVVLLILTSIAIIYFEEGKGSIENKKVNYETKMDIKTMLEELKLRGIGNGIVKNMVKCFKSIKSIFDLIKKHSGTITGHMADMFIYTSFLLPFINAVLLVVGKYHLNMDNFVSNFLGISMGIGGIISKNGISYIIDKMKNRIKINKKDVIRSIEVNKEPEEKSELIKEQ